MKNLQNEYSFLELVKSSKIISGEFLFLDNEEDLLMDQDFKDLAFVDCVLQGGDFCSSDFIDCSFENVRFRDTALVGVVFRGCKFNGCEFHNIDPGFTLEDCSVKSMSITKMYEHSENNP